MLPITTTAHRVTPTVSPLPGHRAQTMISDWNEIRTSGAVPEWMQGVQAVRERLEAIDQAHPDASVQWALDPTGADASVRLPVLELGQKGAPTMLVVAGQHGREPATVAATMDWVEGLLRARTNGDPQATWMLESRRLVVVPGANPRGVAGAAEAMMSAPLGPVGTWDDLGNDPGSTAAPTPLKQYMWMRKNQSAATGGVDLNRNHDAGWAAVPPGKGLEPTQTWPGSSPASEPEVRILDALIERTKPEIVVDMHQFGNFVLATAGEKSKAATARALQRLATTTGIATFTAKQTSTLDSLPKFGMGGTLQARGADAGADLSLTVELGTSFTPTDTSYTDVQRSAGEVLTQLARAVGDPVRVMQGPDVSSAARRTQDGWSVGASDVLTGSRALQSAELVTDPTITPGTGFSLAAADGAFDEAYETLRIPAGAASSGVVGVRARDADGNWGPVTAIPVTAPAP